MNFGSLPRQKARQEHAPAAFASAEQVLRDFFQSNSTSLFSTLRTYVLRMGLAQGCQVQEIALELFQETVAEALAHADRFDGQGSPMPWLLGIAVNMIKRRKAEQAKRFQREELLADLARRYPDLPDEDAVLDFLIPPVTSGPAEIAEANEEAAAILALVSQEDQHVLRLAVLEGHQHTTLARALGTTPGTARMRLHRALRRLRTAWQAQQDPSQKEVYHA